MKNVMGKIRGKLLEKGEFFYNALPPPLPSPEENLKWRPCNVVKIIGCLSLKKCEKYVYQC